MTRILIIEEVPVLRQHAANTVRETLKRTEVVEVIEARCAADGFQQFCAFSPDLVIMDICLQQSSGLSLAERIWSTNPRTKIVFWVHSHHDAFVGEITKISPYEATFGYVLKTESQEKLIHAISSVAIHSCQYTDPAAKTVFDRPMYKSDALTDAEQETLLDITLGLTDRAIASRRGITVRGVQNRLSTMSLKIMRQDHWRLKQPHGLEVFNPRTRLVHEALKRGFMRVDQLACADRDFDDWFASQQFFAPTPPQAINMAVFQ